MKKYFTAICIFCISSLGMAGEWYIVGSGDAENKINTDVLEVKLWEFIAAKSKEKFSPKETYIFQYKFINKHKIYINALCSSKLKDTNEVGAMPEPTHEQLTKDFITVFDGGSCYFGVKFNIKKNRFSKLHINGHA